MIILPVFFFAPLRLGENLLIAAEEKSGDFSLSGLIIECQLTDCEFNLSMQNIRKQLSIR